LAEIGFVWYYHSLCGGDFQGVIFFIFSGCVESWFYLPAPLALDKLRRGIDRHNTPYQIPAHLYAVRWNQLSTQPLRIKR